MANHQAAIPAPTKQETNRGGQTKRAGTMHTHQEAAGGLHQPTPPRWALSTKHSHPLAGRPPLPAEHTATSRKKITFNTEQTERGESGLQSKPVQHQKTVPHTSSPVRPLPLSVPSSTARVLNGANSGNAAHRWRQLGRGRVARMPHAADSAPNGAKHGQMTGETVWKSSTPGAMLLAPTCALEIIEQKCELDFKTQGALGTRDFRHFGLDPRQHAKSGLLLLCRTRRTSLDHLHRRGVSCRCPHGIGGNRQKQRRHVFL
jgi:hypothetical protein